MWKQYRMLLMCTIGGILAFCSCSSMRVSKGEHGYWINHKLGRVVGGPCGIYNATNYYYLYVGDKGLANAEGKWVITKEQLRLEDMRKVDGRGAGVIPIADGCVCLWFENGVEMIDIKILSDAIPAISGVYRVEQ